jgi:hypothetical protein
VSRSRFGRRTLVAALVAVIGLATGVSYAALGAAGGSSPARPRINPAPPKLTNQASATFGYWSKSPVAFLCSLDTGTFTACGSGKTGSVAYAGLSDGEHTFRVKAQLGSTVGKPAEKTWTVDTQAPPAPTFRRKPPDSTTVTRARFLFTDAEPKTRFKCRLDNGAYVHCGHSLRYGHVTKGVHVFCVRALDKAGNTSAPTCTTWVVTPASVTFSISGYVPTGALLYPGGAAVPLNLVFANPHSAPITVQSVTTSVTGTSASGCGAANFSLSQQLQATPTVPAGATASLQGLGVPQSQWPQVRMLDAGNQDACRNASVDLAYTGTATG